MIVTITMQHNIRIGRVKMCHIPYMYSNVGACYTMHQFLKIVTASSVNFAYNLDNHKS